MLSRATATSFALCRRTSDVPHARHIDSAAQCVVGRTRTLSGRYEQLYTLVIFPSWILYAMAAASVIVLGEEAPGPAPTLQDLGYPVVPVLFVCVAVVLIVSTLVDSPRESFLGLVIIAARRAILSSVASIPSCQGIDRPIQYCSACKCCSVSGTKYLKTP